MPQLMSIADAIDTHQEEILKANEKDVTAGQQLLA